MDPLQANPLFANVMPPAKTELSNDLILEALGASAAAILLTVNRSLALRLGYFTVGVGVKPGGGLGVSPLVVYYFLLPPPFGFAAPSKFGLEPNYVRTFLENIGIPGDQIPESELFSTQKTTPEITKERQRIADHVIVNNFNRLASDQTTEALLRDYALFRGKQLGLIPGPAVNLPLGELADAAAKQLLARGLEVEDLVEALDPYVQARQQRRSIQRYNPPPGKSAQGFVNGFVEIGGFGQFLQTLPPDPR